MAAYVRLQVIREVMGCTLLFRSLFRVMSGSSEQANPTPDNAGMKVDVELEWHRNSVDLVPQSEQGIVGHLDLVSILE